jgi:hypothetical protein
MGREIGSKSASPSVAIRGLGLPGAAGRQACRQAYRQHGRTYRYILGFAGLPPIAASLIHTRR